MPRIVKYFFAGGCAAAVDLAIFVTLISLLELHYWIAAFFSFVVATAVNLFLSVHFVFPDREATKKQAAVGVYMISSVGLLLNLIILWVGIEQLSLMPVVAKLVATGLVFFWNYFARNHYVFKARA